VYPLHVILVGIGEQIAADLRRELANLGAVIDGEYPAASAALADPPAAAGGKRLFVVLLKSLGDVVQLKGLNEAFEGWPILAFVDAAADSVTLLDAMRAGAAQVVLLPSQPDDFHMALDRIALQFGFPANVSRVVAGSGVTAGAGATTLAVNLATEFTHLTDTPCVLTELALPMGSLASFLDIEPPVTIPYLLADPDRLDATHVRQALFRISDHLHVLAGAYKSIEPGPVPPERVRRLLELLKQLTNVLIVDMPCTFDANYFQALRLADRVVLVAEQTVPSIQALQVLRGALEQQLGGLRQFIVLNRYDPRHDHLTVSHLENLLGLKRQVHVVHHDPAFPEAVNNGRPLRQEAPRSRALKEIQQLTRAVLDCRAAAPVRRSWWRRLLGRG
jgi:pilus assembly protein CpaE